MRGAPAISGVAPVRGPLAGGTVVTVTGGGRHPATSPADLFTYETIPTVTAIAPSEGPLAGGTAVTITGTDFTAGSTAPTSARRPPRQ